MKSVYRNEINKNTKRRDGGRNQAEGRNVGHLPPIFVSLITTAEPDPDVPEHRSSCVTVLCISNVKVERLGEGMVISIKIGMKWNFN